MLFLCALFLLFDIESFVYVIMDRFPVEKERCSLLRYLRYLFIATIGEFLFSGTLGLLYKLLNIFRQTWLFAVFT